MELTALRRLFLFRAALLLFLWPCWIGVSESQAQDASGPTFTYAWRGAFLSEALQQFTTDAEIDFSWDPLLVEGKRIFCVVKDAPLKTVLKCILDGTGLDYVQRSSGLYTLIIASEGPPLYGNLRGIILDQETEQPVSDAHILLAEAVRNEASQKERGRVANTEGMFLFSSLLPGLYRITVSHLGYRRTSTTVRIRAGSISSAEVILPTEIIRITSPVVIDGIGMQPSSTLLGSSISTRKQLTGGVSSGTSGILQALDGMMGVRVNDATADIHIQGGEAGEHQFRLDGAPVFIPLNVATFIGPFSPFALGKIKVNKAGFDVTLGSQIAGVIEAEHDLHIPSGKSSGSGQVSGQDYIVQVDPISTNARLSGFVARPGHYHATYMTAARIGTWRIGAPSSLRGLLDRWNTVDTFLLSAFADRNTPFANLPPEGTPTVGFFDWHSATRIRFGSLKTLYASAYYGSSKLGNNLSDGGIAGSSGTTLSRARDEYQWKNGAAQVRLQSVLGSRTLGSIRARGSFYRLTHDFTAPDAFSATTPEDDGNRIIEVALESRLDYIPTVGHHIQAGFESILTDSRFIIAGTQLLPLRHTSSDWRLAWFAEDKIQFGKNAVLEAGTRFTYLNARRSLYVEPRLSARFDWVDTSIGGISLFIGTGIYRQFVNQFDVSSRSPRTFVSSSRFWIGIDRTVSPPKAAHLTAELLIRPSSAWTLRFESHYKKLYQVLSIDYSADAPAENTSISQDQFLRSTNGYSYGFASLIQRSIGPGSIKLRFDYTESKRKIESLFRDRLLTVPWNEPYRIEASLDLAPFDRFVLLARWKTILGRKWGYRQAYYDFLSAHLNDLDALLRDLSANGVSQDAVSRIERQVDFYKLSDPESHRLGAIQQLDFSVAYSVPLSGMSLQIRADVINVLNERNTAEWRFDLDEDSYFGQNNQNQTGLLERGNRPLLPRVFTLAARLSF